MSLNLNVLKSIGFETYTTDKGLVREFRKRKQLTDDMIDIIDHVDYLSTELTANNPSFSNKYQTLFSFEGRLFLVAISLEGYISLKYQGNCNVEYDLDEEYTYSDFLEDNDVYYYLNLDNMTVCSLWNGKPCIIKENV